MPFDVQILDQEAGHDHPHPVVHPTLLEQLPHASIDDRDTREAPLPRLEAVARVVVVHRLEGLVVVAERGVGPLVQDVSIELTERQLADVGLSTL